MIKINNFFWNFEKLGRYSFVQYTLFSSEFQKKNGAGGGGGQQNSPYSVLEMMCSTRKGHSERSNPCDSTANAHTALLFILFVLPNLFTWLENKILRDEGGGGVFCTESL